MERTVRVADVRTFQTKSGNTRYVLRDGTGKEYTTFREEIGRAALAAQGKEARIEYHEEQRGGFQNVYLDAVALLDPAAADSEDAVVDEVAWKTAVDSAPWLLGSTPPKREVPPEELFEKLQPFKELVAEDIRDGDDDEAA
ncbi:MAG TPA: hypothetical protein VI142_02190 [Gaiellaceae bacterium]